METVTLRVRSLVWFVTGALLATAVTLMFVHAWRVDAAPGDSDATLVPITPCRLVDTREPGESALGAGQTRTIKAHGTNGPIQESKCTIPDEAVALSMNVTALDATAPTFWTIWPAGKARPVASSLNPNPGQPPTPNAVTTRISSQGKFNVFNAFGTAGMLVDVNGYYTSTSLTELADRVAANEAGIASLDDREPFAVTATALGTNLTVTPTAIVSVTVKAPVAGQVTLSSAAFVNHPTDGGDIQCAIYEDAAIPPISIAATEPSYQRWETGGLGNEGTVPGHRTFDIAAGATTTYSLACEEIVNGGAIGAASLVAIFTPAP